MFITLYCCFCELFFFFLIYKIQYLVLSGEVFRFNEDNLQKTPLGLLHQVCCAGQYFKSENVILIVNFHSSILRKSICIIHVLFQLLQQLYLYTSQNVVRRCHLGCKLQKLHSVESSCSKPSS